MPEFLVEGITAWAPSLGANVVPDGVLFRVWAPAAREVAVEIETPNGPVVLPMSPIEEDGEFGGLVQGIGAGARYRYRLDDTSYPDPCSRYQPEGPHGPSQVVDATAFAWTDNAWPGVAIEGQVIYEVHVGTATPEGTFDALIAYLPHLRALGVTVLELMPVAEFPGVRGWGYDGVGLFAPHHAYGGPEAMRRLVDAAHSHGLGVILDGVYNHLGPDGNYLRAFSPDYFTDRHKTPWGDAFNFDGRNSHRVREFVLASAWRWIAEFHLDGLRLDAVHAIFDASAWHVVADITARARATAYPRPIIVTAESESNDVTLIRSPIADGWGLDAVWADDFHHALRVLLTGEREGYYQDYSGSAAEVAHTVGGGFLYQGQHAPHLGHTRGTTVTDESASAFVYCIQNHDQIGNRALGERLNTLISPAAYRAASALLLLVPQTPLLFMGQEFAATAPFLYFTDHQPVLGRLVTEGRRREFAGFAAFRDEALRQRIPDPQANATFVRSKLDWSERETNVAVLALYTDLLALRRTDPVLRVQDRSRMYTAAPLPRVVTLHRWSDDGHRLIVVNFGDAVAVPLASLHADSLPPGTWQVQWHSNTTRYGGTGESATLREHTLTLPANTAVILERAVEL